MALVSFPYRLAELARRRPDDPAVTCGDRTISRAELERAGNRLGRYLQGLGVGVGDFVTVALPNSVDWFVTYVACWKIGAIPQPVSAKLPVRELAAIVELASPKVVVGIDPDGPLGAALPAGVVGVPAGHVVDPTLSDAPLPDAVSPAWKAPTSGGSTGRPKLIVSGDPALLDDEAPPGFLLSPDGCLVMPGPLYHNGPAVWACQALLSGSHVVLLARFDAEATLAAIERHRADVVYLVPTMMKRIWRLPEEVRLGHDLSSLRVVWHLAEPCPPWLKQVWIDWLGPERIVELYAGTEAQVATVITGVEWLAHRGSVGRPPVGQVKICDPDGVELSAGEQGEVWMRSARETPTYRYIGATAKTLPGGWESLGDMGWLDADGYLYLGDRLNDMILSGGANIYPAEVEAAVNEHPAVRSCIVIGLPDDDLGHVVHAIVEADAVELPTAELLAFLGERLAPYKVPRSVEYVDEALRDDAGKVRRSAHRTARLEPSVGAPPASAPTAAGPPTRYDERPVDDTPVHTAELPATPTRDRNIPATAWVEAPDRLLRAGDDIGSPLIAYKRRIHGWLLWRAGPATDADARYVAIDARDLERSFEFRLFADGTGRGIGPSGTEHERFRSWKEDLRDHPVTG